MLLLRALICLLTLWSEQAFAVMQHDLSALRSPSFAIDNQSTSRGEVVAYYGYRYYSPEAGRWVSRDPINERGGVNLYSMCSNALTVNIDKLGHALQPTNHTTWGPKNLPIQCPKYTVTAEDITVLNGGDGMSQNDLDKLSQDYWATTFANYTGGVVVTVDIHVYEAADPGDGGNTFNGGINAEATQPGTGDGWTYYWIQYAARTGALNEPSHLDISQDAGNPYYGGGTLGAALLDDSPTLYQPLPGTSSTTFHAESWLVARTIFGDVQIIGGMSWGFKVIKITN